MASKKKKSTQKKSKRTAFDLTPQLKEQWRAVGCHDFIQKPISNALLNSTIKRVAVARSN